MTDLVARLLYGAKFGVEKGVKGEKFDKFTFMTVWQGKFDKLIDSARQVIIIWISNLLKFLIKYLSHS